MSLPDLSVADSSRLVVSALTHSRALFSVVAHGCERAAVAVAALKRRQRDTAAEASNSHEFDYLRDEVAARVVDRLNVSGVALRLRAPSLPAAR